MKAIVLILFFCLSSTYCRDKNLGNNNNKITDENQAKQYLDSLEKELSEVSRANSIAGFESATNVNEENEKKKMKEGKRSLELDKKIYNEVIKYDFENFKDESIRRRMKKEGVLGVAALPPEVSKEYMEISGKMAAIYGNGQACVAGKCKLPLDPDLNDLMAKERDWDKLTEVWKAWRDAAGKPVRQLYQKYVNISDKVAKVNKFPSFDVFSLVGWETPDLKDQVRKLWDELMPTYQLFHAFVRMKLRQKYGNRMPKDGTIPAHITGNMWGQAWTKIMDLVQPFPNKKTVDVTESLKKQNYTALKIFKMAEKFFVDLGLKPMTEQFWKNSMLTKPKDRKVVCHATAFDMSDKKDYRIKMCTQLTMADFITIHHEMGHIEYYMLYANQHALFREGANPGFHEAIGDTISMSVGTPVHLHKVGLFGEAEIDEETTINYQMSKALDRLANLPFAYLVDVWRWDVFSGKVPYEQWNKHWWELRLKYQGMSPPIKRSEEDFDPGAKYHIPTNVEYIRYFVAIVLQFQFHKSLCSIAQPNVPIHKCDIDKSKAAGKKFAEGLQLGSSRLWPDVLQIMTGSREMSVKPLIEYFQPLIKFLEKETQNEKIGWNSDVNQYMENSSPVNKAIPETNSNRNPNPNPNPNPNLNRNPNRKPNPNPFPNTNLNPNLNPNTNLNPNLNPNTNLNPNLNPNTNLNPNPIPNTNFNENSNPNPNSEPNSDPNSNFNPNPIAFEPFQPFQPFQPFTNGNPLMNANQNDFNNENNGGMFQMQQQQL